MPNESPRRNKIPQGSYHPDLDREIQFVDHLTDEIMLLIQRTVIINPQQNDVLERNIRRYLRHTL